MALVDARLRLEVEVGQFADRREVGHPEPPLVPARHLAVDQERHRLAQRQLLLRRLVDQAFQSVADAGQMQARQPPVADRQVRESPAPVRPEPTVSAHSSPAGGTPPGCGRKRRLTP